MARRSFSPTRTCSHPCQCDRKAPAVALFGCSPHRVSDSAHPLLALVPPRAVIWGLSRDLYQSSYRPSLLIGFEQYSTWGMISWLLAILSWAAAFPNRLSAVTVGVESELDLSCGRIPLDDSELTLRDCSAHKPRVSKLQFKMMQQFLSSRLPLLSKYQTKLKPLATLTVSRCLPFMQSHGHHGPS